MYNFFVNGIKQVENWNKVVLNNIIAWCYLVHVFLVYFYIIVFYGFFFFSFLVETRPRIRFSRDNKPRYMCVVFSSKKKIFVILWYPTDAGSFQLKFGRKHEKKSARARFFIKKKERRLRLYTTSHQLQLCGPWRGKFCGACKQTKKKKLFSLTICLYFWRDTWTFCAP